MLRTVLIVLVVLLLLGALPTWPYSAGWGYYPSGGLGLVLIILVILILADRLQPLNDGSRTRALTRPDSRVSLAPDRALSSNLFGSNLCPAQRGKAT